MKGPKFALVAALLAAPFCCGCGPPAQTAAWVVRYDIAAPEGPALVCNEAQAAGLDTLVVQVRGRADAYYKSVRVPRAEPLQTAPEGFDPLAAVLGACDRTRVVAWLNVYYLWGGTESPLDPAHTTRSRPEWLLYDADGRCVSDYSAVDRALGWIEGIYADPAAMGYRERFAEVVREVVEAYPVAGVHLDFVRYPGPHYGQTGPLGDLFATAWGLDPRWIPDELRVPDLGRWLSGASPPADRVLTTAALLWAEARASQVTALVRNVRRVVDAVRPGLEVSAAVFPDAGSAYLEKGQDWRTWASLGLADALFPMAYFGGPERVTSQLAEMVALVRGPAPRVRLWAGLGAYIKTPEEVSIEARAARLLGYNGVCLFDAASVIEKPEGLRAYAAAVGGARSVLSKERSRPSWPRPQTPGGRRLAAIVERAAGGIRPQVPGIGAALDDRWSEFERAQRGAIPETLARLRRGVHVVPPWVTMDGVFRYVHPEDGKTRRRAQFGICDDARERLLTGEDCAAVAQELSQGGTRKLGGVLARRYLSPSEPLHGVVSGLEPGEVSPVFQASNGCWVYQIRAKGEEVSLPLEDIPWPARRIVFRRALNAAMGELPATSTFAGKRNRADVSGRGGGSPGEGT